MNNLVNFDVTFKRPDLLEGNGNADPRHAQKLEKIRYLSNLIQALENAVTQCEADADFSGTERVIQRHLADARDKLRELIHQVD